MIYLATNSYTFKSYVGQTSKLLEQRRLQHEKNARGGRRSRFYSALRKYGAAAFTWRVLVSQSGDRKTTDAYERFLIALFNTQDPSCGYNLTAGGEGMAKPSDETRRRMSDSHKGHTQNRGRRFSEQIREKMVARLRGYTGHLGHFHSPEAKAKMRVAHLGKHTEPKSLETRAKMSRAAFAREAAKRANSLQLLTEN
jgi:group I intron endonuclease